jgi:hypothetical protein
MKEKMDNLNFFMELVRLGYLYIDTDGIVWRLSKEIPGN